MAEHSFFNTVGSRVNSSLCNDKDNKLCMCLHCQAESIITASSHPYPAKVLEGLSVDDFGEVVHNNTQALLLQLRGQNPHLLSPLDFWETANQLLGATEHGYCILHSLNSIMY